MAKQTPPTHRIRVLDQSTNKKAEVGAAWMSPEGYLRIHLNPGVTLSWNDGLMITAFPLDRKVDDTNGYIEAPS